MKRRRNEKTIIGVNVVREIKKKRLHKEKIKHVDDVLLLLQLEACKTFDLNQNSTRNMLSNCTDLLKVQ